MEVMARGICRSALRDLEDGSSASWMRVDLPNDGAEFVADALSV